MSRRDRGRSGPREDTSPAAPGTAEATAQPSGVAEEPTKVEASAAAGAPADATGTDPRGDADGGVAPDGDTPQGDAASDTSADEAASADASADSGAGDDSPADAPPASEDAPAATAAAEPPSQDVPAPPSRPRPSEEEQLECHASARRAAAAVQAALDELVAGGASEEDADGLLRSKLNGLGEEAANRVDRGAAYRDVTEWFEEETKRVLAEVLADARKPKGPPVMPNHVRCELLTGVSGWGYTLEGHRREHWLMGEVGDFKPHVVDSAPSAFKRLS